MNRKTILWTVVAFLAGGVLAARQNILEHQPGPHNVRIFLITPQANGKATGCGDAAVAVDVKSTFDENPVADALQTLFAIKRKRYGKSGLYNALYQSDLKVESVEINNKTANVKLGGALKLGGECDNPRVRSQLEKTILMASKADIATVWINNKTLEDVLSLRQ
jgi:hypothetical protein